MPRRNDIESICIVGSGPIVIGQAAEFDYAGCQALKVLREDGFRTIVVNSNPATIMTDPGFADRTYLEPLDAALRFAVAASEAAEVSHVSLYDGTVEGLDLPDLRARSLQFHPEAGPGPHDAWPLLTNWVQEVRLAEAA